MYSEQSSELSLNVSARCISAVHGDRKHHRFVVGTCSSPAAASSPATSSSSHNQIYMVRYDEELGELVMDTQLDHYTGEVWCCSACPLNKRLLVTCGGGGGVASSVLGNDSSTVLWRLPSDIFAAEEDEAHELMEEDAESHDGGRKRGDSLTAALRGAIDRGLDSVHTMEEVCTLVHPDERSSVLRGRISDIVWNPECWESESMNLDSSFTTQGSACNMITVGHASNIITTWSIGTSSALPIQRIDISSLYTTGDSNGTRKRLIPTPPKAAWDPHNTNIIALTCGPDVALYDLRSSTKPTGMISPCHSLGVTSLDYNPNKPHVLATSGQEGFLKFWDLRSSVVTSSSQMKPTSIPALIPTDVASFPHSKKQAHPLKVVQGGHSHWVSVVQYNRAHDQLILTGGTVGMVNLWRINTHPSSPLVDLGKDSLSKAKSDSKEKKYEDNSISTDADHDNSKEESGNTSDDQDVCVDTMELNDSVYSLAWSAADPWVYAALCYDGTVAVRNVPSKEKYKILL